jgi:hypothetical protein
MPPTARYERPFHWWGPGWDTPTPRSLADLLRDGTLEPATAALLWASLIRRCSLAVIGGQGGLGKTTLLTALLPLLPHDTRHIYLRGCFEPFAFLDDPAVDPTRSALLLNEISPHLPVYLWGPGVGRALHAAQSGFTLLATAHGESVHEFVTSLTGSPLRVPAASIAAFNLVAILEQSSATASGRRLSEIWRLGATRDGLTIDRVDIATDREHGIQSAAGGHSTFAATARQLFAEREIATRYQHLCSLRDGRIDRLPSEVGDVHGARHPLK